MSLESLFEPYANIEQFLQTHIFPDLEKGRPNWDVPHTIAVVFYVKQLVLHNPQLALDPAVMLITAYAHDWGYADLFEGGAPVDFDTIKEQKALHMIKGAKKIAKLLNDPIFDFLTPYQKQRIIHLVGIHDKMEELEDDDERVFMEADTLGALDISRVTPTFTAKSNDSYMTELLKRRSPKFLTQLGKSELERLIEIREQYYRANVQ